MSTSTRGGAGAPTGADPGAHRERDTPPSSSPNPPDAVRARRSWSPRRNAAALTALVLLGAAGALLYEEILVKNDHRAHSWRTWVSDQLAQRTLDDPWVVAASSVVCALGLLLLILAVTPGLRRRLALKAEGTSGLRADLDRRGVGVMLRRAALETPGVQEAKVKVGRRRARLRAVVSFGNRDEVEAALTERLVQERQRLGLVRPPLVKVRIRGRDGSSGGGRGKSGGRS